MTNTNSIQNKYEKKATYLWHQELADIFSKGFWSQIKINFIIVLILGLILRDYPISLGALDVAFSVMALLFYFLVRPFIMRGKLKAYFRRTYYGKSLYTDFMAYMIQGSLIRTTLWGFFYGLVILAERGNDFHYEKAIEGLQQMLIHPITTPLAVVLALVYFYWVFYQEKYTTIPNYSNGVMQRYLYGGLNMEGAFRSFRKDTDAEHKIERYVGVRYDGYMPNQSSDTVHYENDESFSAMEYDAPSASVEKAVIKKATRRKSRNLD